MISQYYQDVLQRLHEKIRKKRLELLRKNSWFLHHDNAPALAALSIRWFCAINHMTALPHPPYSPALVPSSVFFSKIKSVLKGRRFDSIDGIKRNFSKALNDISKEALKDCFAK